MKTTVISIIVGVLIIGGAVLFSRGTIETDKNPQNNVSIIDGKQIIEIDARGGYTPRYTVAKANMPTIIKMNTKGTFDCSSALVIPSISYRKNLPPSGETLIDISPQQEGTVLRGLCAMGMYNFSIAFN